jgi:ABC-type uncharacterized transport system involved in gliding motility auxiliary subunit
VLKSLRHADRSRLALIGIGLVIVLLFSVNVLADLTLTSSRLDLTQDRLFTVSEGTKKTLAEIDEPIDIRFYYSKRLDELGPYFASHAQRVEELLEEYRRLSGGKIRIERLDPQPFSREEDLAVAEGLRGLPVGSDGAQLYFGLSGRNSTDDLQVIEYLAPERADFLEYDLTRMVYDLAEPDKPVVAIMGDLPLMGSQMNQWQPWLVVEAMFQFFDVRFLGGSHDEIEDDVDVLMLAQAASLDEKALYAIDQFVMRGGRVLALVDPHAESLAAGANPMARGGNAVEALKPLLTAWGVELPSDRIVGDAQAAQRVSAQVGGREVVVQYLPWLALDQQQLARGDVVTAELDRVTMQTAGWIAGRDGASTEIEPLITSSPQSMAIDVAKVEGMPDPGALIRDFEPRGRPFVLAARVTGPIKSAFPEGPPADEARATEDGGNEAQTGAAEPSDEPAQEEAEKEEAGQNAAEHLAEATAPLNLVLIADSDLLADHSWVRPQSLLGQDVTMPIANNGDLVINAVDNLTGSEGLIALRGRGLSVRPFEVVQTMEQEAELKYRTKEQELLERIEQTQQKIRQLQEEERQSGVILTSEQQAEIDDFRTEMIGLRQELRSVQRSLREDVEQLSLWVRAINIWAVPVLIAMVAIGLAVVRRWRAHRFAAAHGH